MEAALVGVGTGVMKPLLSKLSKLLEEEYGRLKGVRRKVKDTKHEMRSLHAALEVLADAEQLDAEMIEWRDDVRELSYDMEDCLEDFMVRADHKQDGPKGLKGFFDRLKKLKPRHEIADEIKKLKARAIEASERHKRYKIGCPTPGSLTPEIDPRLHALYVDVGNLVGIEGPKKHIIEWFKNEYSSTQQLRVVSIVGPGGLGKTTLANTVFQTIRSEFKCAAFVSLSRKPNMRSVLWDIADRMKVADITTDDDVCRLIDRLRDHLGDKKYLVVIDDVWNTKDWEIIRHALLDNDHGSRIVISTRNSAVASCCSQGDYVYSMKSLGFDDSKRLFLKRAFHSEDLLPSNLKIISEEILEKCAGLPLAIITISSLLAHKTAEDEWKRVLAAIGSSLAKEAGDMSKILSLSYFDLPHHMRTCLLYLSAYPEDDIIEKRSLIQKWIVEGFIPEAKGQSTYEVGEGYFVDFINRSLIQPSTIYHKDGRLEACRVHDVILDFITCKAEEENFMTSFGDTEQGQKHKVRRLSIVTRKNETATVSGNFSHVRSLGLFGYFGQNSLLDFPALRVLDLEGCFNLTNDQLANIDKLFLLKYLRLGSGSNSIRELPEEIGKLKYLETLDMHGVVIRKLPSNMARLQRLSRLYATLKPTCLSDGVIGQLQSLEELENVEAFVNEPEKFLLELRQLSKLRTLSVMVKHSRLRENVDVVRFVGTLLSSYNIPHLSISYKHFHRSDLSLELEPWCPANPAALQKMRFDKLHIDKVPNWMVSLVNLRGLDFFMYLTEPEDVAILGEIPALAFLKLRTYYGRCGRIFIRGGGFRSLKYCDLEIGLCGTAVEFEEGSMPKLEHLELTFKAHKLECVNYASDFGIHHLSTLTKVDVNVELRSSRDIVRRLIHTAIGKLRSHPTLSHHSFHKTCNFKTTFKSIYEEQAASSHQHVRESSDRSSFGQLLEEIHRDALPRLRVLGMVRTLDSLVKSLCAAAAAESAAVALALSEIQSEIRCADAATKAAASYHLSRITCDLLASPATAAATPDDLVVVLAQELVGDLASGSIDAIARAACVMAASPSVAAPVLFKPLAACLVSPHERASTAAAAAFCKLSAPPADAAPFLPFVPELYNLLTTSRSDRALVNVLRVLARLAPLESSLAARIADPVCQLLTRSSHKSLTLECIRTVLAVLPAHGAAVSLAIGKAKEFLAFAHHTEWIQDLCRDVFALSLGDADSNIRREALHLLMGMVDGKNAMGIAGMLVNHAAKSDPEFANEILGAVLAACHRNVYELVKDFDWYVLLLADMSRSLHCAQADEIGRQLVDLGLRVQVARPVLVRAAKTLLIDPALFGNHLLFPVLSAAAWVSGEYVVFTKDPVELVEALLQPRTTFLPMSVRAVYIQAVHKVINFYCNTNLERLAESSKEVDVSFIGLAIDHTDSWSNWGSEASFWSAEEQVVEKDPFSQRSILYMINLIETTVGPLVDCNEVEVMEGAPQVDKFCPSHKRDSRG